MRDTLAWWGTVEAARRDRPGFSIQPEQEARALAACQQLPAGELRATGMAAAVEVLVEEEMFDLIKQKPYLDFLLQFVLTMQEYNFPMDILYDNMDHHIAYIYQIAQLLFAL